ncbi:asparagine synthase-related protein [Saccharothrix sp. AJ9571]|nr:asparagine synthase-related protein [Saccharothrix sp. AJ9571]
MADPRGLNSWWHRQADRLTDPPPSRYAPTDLDWGQPLRAPSWATPAALAAAGRVLRDTAAHARPLAPQRGQHATLTTIGTNAPAYRQLARVFDAAGVRLEMPFFDDRVIDTALAVLPHERRSPWRYRPLLAEALRDILPPSITGRSTKGEFGQDVRDGLARNLPAVLEVFADSALATAGLIDPDKLRAALLAPQRDNTAMFALEGLLGCETWLRHTTTTIQATGATTSCAPRAIRPGSIDDPTPAH